MLRDTMIRTIPVAMIAIDVLWTDRFHRLRAVRKSPPDRMLKAIQMAISAITMPSSRVSSSDWASTERHVLLDGGAVVGALGVPTVAGCAGERTSVMHHAFSSGEVIPDAPHPSGRARRVRDTVPRPQPQAATEPASTPWQSVALSIQPASSTTS